MTSINPDHEDNHEHNTEQGQNQNEVLGMLYILFFPAAISAQIDFTLSADPDQRKLLRELKLYPRVNETLKEMPKYEVVGPSAGVHILITLLLLSLPSLLSDFLRTSFTVSAATSVCL